MRNKQQPIGPLTDLSIFIKEYPNERLHQNFRLLQMNFPKHRTVKGDGNCFYRAFAFLYLSHTSLNSFKQVFPYTKINYSKPGTNLKSDGTFQKKLKEMWTQHIVLLRDIENQIQKQNMLAKLFNEVDTFDELMIAYLRSANYSNIMQKRSQLMPFLRGSQDYSKLLQRVGEFGTESEGIQIYSLAQKMQTKITIFCVDGQGLQPVEYMEQLQNQNFYLFYRPGHYDIVYPGQSKNQVQSEIKQQQLKPSSSSLKSYLLGSFDHGPMGRLWFDTIVIGSLSYLSYYLYLYF